MKHLDRRAEHTWTDPLTGEFCAAFNESSDDPAEVLAWSEEHGEWLDCSDHASAVELIRLATENASLKTREETLESALSSLLASLAAYPTFPDSPLTLAMDRARKVLRGKEKEQENA